MKVVAVDVMSEALLKRSPEGEKAEG